MVLQYHTAPHRRSLAILLYSHSHGPGDHGRRGSGHEERVRRKTTLGLCPCSRSAREFARVFGVDFFSVLSRGSQFKVESFMLRIAKPESFVLLSPSKQDVSAHLILVSVHVSQHTGRQTKRCRVYAPHHGTPFCILYQPSCSPRLSITVSLHHDRV